MNARDATIDYAKGIAIVAIVLGHVLRGLASSEIVDGESGAFLTADRFLYMFHLSVFAFLAALFVSRAVERDGSLTYLRSRGATFLYLYVVWSLLQGAVKLLTGALVNTPTSLADILRLWVPEGQLWFLPWLIVMTTAVVVARPWGSRTRAVASLSVAAVVSFALWGISGPVAGTQGLGLTVFFFAGAICGAKRFIGAVQSVRMVVWGLACVASWAILVALVFFTDATPPTIEGDQRTALSVALGGIASCAGVVGVIAISRLASVLGARVAWLAFIGQRTLEIFLAHIIAASGTRIILDVAGIENPTIHIVAGMIAGLVLPLGLWWACNRLRFPWLFESPQVFTGKSERASKRVRATTA